ncbi:carbamate kinase [Mycobacterium sp. NPDC003323]
MRIVIALGGNAILRRGQPMTADVQRANIRSATASIATVAPGNELIIAHGNGPQVGLLALQAAAYHAVAPYPLDVLDAQTEAMIGYVIEQELGNLLPAEQALATLLTMIEVDSDDPAFASPTKPIGPIYDRDTAERLRQATGWTIAADGADMRRVVPSPRPKRIAEIAAIRALVDAGTIVICAGGGGIPTMRDEHGLMVGVEAVIDKDHAAALLAEELDADLLVIATDVDGVYTDWGTPRRQRLMRVTPDDLATLTFSAGSMGPKVDAASRFVRNTGRNAVIGAQSDIEEMVSGRAGTTVTTYRDRGSE